MADNRDEGGSNLANRDCATTVSASARLNTFVSPAPSMSMSRSRPFEFPHLVQKLRRDFLGRVEHDIPDTRPAEIRFDLAVSACNWATATKVVQKAGVRLDATEAHTGQCSSRHRSDQGPTWMGDRSTRDRQANASNPASEAVLTRCARQPTAQPGQHHGGSRKKERWR